MKLTKTFIGFMGALLVTGSLIAADKPTKAKRTAAHDAYQLDASQSKISWLGKKVTGQHNGTIAIKSGQVTVSKGNIAGGKIVVDANSINVEDLQGEWKDKLTGHLKSDDFFGVATYPEIVFEIKSVEALADSANGNAKVKGDLTIKGKTHPIEFPATIRVTDKWVTAEAKEIAVDRTLYDIRYGSGKFFQNLGDKTINDQFWLAISFAASK